MYSRVLDAQVVSAVMAAGPAVRPAAELRARLVLTRLVIETRDGRVDFLVDERGERRYEMRVGDLALMLGISAHQAGRAVGDLGLQAVRWGDGYRFFWNEAQLALLERAFAKEGFARD